MLDAGTILQATSISIGAWTLKKVSEHGEKLAAGKEMMKSITERLNRLPCVDCPAKPTEQEKIK